MSKLRIAVLGGTGFIGRSLCERLVAEGHEVRILARRRERHRELLVLPTAQVVEADIHNPVVLKREFQDMHAVINLAGILNESRQASFELVHVELPAKVVQACRQTGVSRLLHMSALHADPQAPSEYLRSKGRGEKIVQEAESSKLHVTIFRPSVIFGARDSFTNRFAGLLEKVPFVFPLACPQARMQPVYVADVVEAFVRSLELHASFGQRYNLCGPTAYSLREIVTLLLKWRGLRRHVLPLNDFLSRLQAAVMQFAPGKPFTLDNYRSLQVESTCDVAFPALFNITPAAFEAVVPTYLSRSEH